MINMLKNKIQIFRFIGDGLMLLSRIIMLKKIYDSKSVSGLSLKTQMLYLIVYICRYLDLTWVTYKRVSFGKEYIKWLEIYNSGFKIFLIFYHFYILYLIGVKFKKTYHKRYDSFPLSVILVLGCIISFVLSYRLFFFADFCYTLSLILESVAILPQLVMTQESEDCESMTSKYIVFLGLYRLNYLVYFIFKKITGEYVDLLMMFTSLIQTILYIDFFKVYYNYMINRNNTFIKAVKD